MVFCVPGPTESRVIAREARRFMPEVFSTFKVQYGKGPDAFFEGEKGRPYILFAIPQPQPGTALVMAHGYDGTTSFIRTEPTGISAGLAFRTLGDYGSLVQSEIVLGRSHDADGLEHALIRTLVEALDRGMFAYPVVHWLPHERTQPIGMLTEAGYVSEPLSVDARRIMSDRTSSPFPETVERYLVRGYEAGDAGARQLPFLEDE